MNTAAENIELIFQKMRNAEALAKQGLERKYLKKRNNGSIYIALEKVPIDWNWTPKQIGWIDEMWNAGVSLQDMAVELNRKPMEVFLIIMDRNYHGKIKPRKNGIWG